MRLPPDFISALENADDKDHSQVTNNAFNRLKSLEGGCNSTSLLFQCKQSNNKFTDHIVARLRAMSIHQCQSSNSDLFFTSFLQHYTQEANEKDKPFWTEKYLMR